MLSSIKIW